MKKFKAKKNAKKYRKIRALNTASPRGGIRQ